MEKRLGWAAGVVAEEMAWKGQLKWDGREVRERERAVNRTSSGNKEGKGWGQMSGNMWSAAETNTDTPTLQLSLSSQLPQQGTGARSHFRKFSKYKESEN